MSVLMDHFGLETIQKTMQEMMSRQKLGIFGIFCLSNQNEEKQYKKQILLFASESLAPLKEIRFFELVEFLEQQKDLLLHDKHVKDKNED